MTHTDTWEAEADVVATPRNDAQACRNLISEVLRQALNDALYMHGIEDGESSATAYLWLIQSTDACRYCELIDVDYPRFRAAVIQQAGERCELSVRARSQRADELLARWRKHGTVGKVAPKRARRRK